MVKRKVVYKWTVTMVCLGSEITDYILNLYYEV